MYLLKRFNFDHIRMQACYRFVFKVKNLPTKNKIVTSYTRIYIFLSSKYFEPKTPWSFTFWLLHGSDRSLAVSIECLKDLVGTNKQAASYCEVCHLGVCSCNGARITYWLHQIEYSLSFLFFFPGRRHDITRNIIAIVNTSLLAVSFSAHNGNSSARLNSKRVVGRFVL